MPMINITRPFYTMATTDGKTAEITMYGRIVEQRPVDFWTGEPIQGNFIIGDEFLEDLKQVEHCTDITITIKAIPILIIILLLPRSIGYCYIYQLKTNWLNNLKTRQHWFCLSLNH